MNKVTKLGICPENWDIVTVDEVFSVNDENLLTNTNPKYSFHYITIENISTEKIDYANCTIYEFQDAPGRARRIIHDGDILISGVRPNLKGFAIFHKPNRDEWICTTGCFVLRAKVNQSTIFYFNQILGAIGAKQFDSWVSGTNYPAISDRDLKKMKLFSAPYPEQQAIAGIISKVDQCIENVQKSIEATQKLKKSLMQNLLTGRMKPDGTMRKETDFWEHPKMGKVPNGWEVKQVKDIAIQVTDGEHQTPDRTESGYFLLSARNIKNGYLTLDDVDYVGEKEFKRIQKRCHPEENDILISCSGTIGNVCKVPAGLECVMVRSAALVKVNHERINADFLEYLLQSFPLQIGMKIAVSASVQGNLFQGAIKKLRFMAPVDLIEQRDIANILNDTTNQIISEQNKIASLQRLKKSLMQNLLTGQKRVDVAKINSILESMN